MTRGSEKEPVGINETNKLIISFLYMKRSTHSNNANLKQYAARLEGEYPMRCASPADYCIVYVSSSKGLFSEEQLVGILEKSRQKNQSLGISGVLLYCNGSIMQVLEGPEDCVKTLYNVIHQDDRHADIIVLYNYPIEKRSFSNWSMGYKTLSVSKFNGVKEQIGITSDSTKQVFNQSSSILTLIQEFYLNNHLN